MRVPASLKRREGVPTGSRISSFPDRNFPIDKIAVNAHISKIDGAMQRLVLQAPGPKVRYI